MEVGFGALGLTPDQLWHLTIPEFNAKLRGWREVNCPQKGPTEREAEEMSRDADELMQRFPDGPLPKAIRKKHAANKAAARARWQTTS